MRLRALSCVRCPRRLLGLLPPPLRGRGGEGGGCASSSPCYPPPDPPPKGGGDAWHSSAASSRRGESCVRPITFHVVTAGWPCGSCFIHQPRRVVLAAERQVDAAFVLRRPALDHRPVGLADAAALEQPAELGQRLAVAAEHEAAGGVAVEPVRERRRARQAEAQRVEMILQALAALRAPCARRSPPACRSPASARRDRAGEPPSLPGSRSLAKSGKPLSRPPA